MAVTKRTRFEVLRRDNYTCQYCGATAPDAKITVDHVLPVALGGTDEHTNLVAACWDCNSGKGSTSPDESTVAEVESDALKWAAARKVAAARLEDQALQNAEHHSAFYSAWTAWDVDAEFLPNDYASRIDGWMESGLSIERINEAVEVAMSNRRIPYRRVFRYLCGIIKNWLWDLDQETRRVLDEAQEAAVSDG